MNDFLIMLLMAILIAFALRRVFYRARKGGSCCGERQQTEERNKVFDRNKDHYSYAITIPIGGMTCENCAVKVQNALNSLNGVWAKVDIAEHKAHIRCKEAPDEKLLRQTIISAGYIPM